MAKEKPIMIKGMKHKSFPRITEYDWQIAPYKNIKSGLLIYFLNKLYRGRSVGSIMMNAKELKNLKRFMRERKIK